MSKKLNQQSLKKLKKWRKTASKNVSNRSINYLSGQFPGKVISLRGDHPWPARSPDLAICDFFLWGYLKHKIWSQQYNLQPTTLRQLKLAITNASNGLDPAMIRRSFNGMINRVNRCIRANGNTFPDE